MSDDWRDRILAAWAWGVVGAAAVFSALPIFF